MNVTPAQHRLEGRGTLWLPPANESRESLRLRLGKNMRDFVIEVLEPEEIAGPATLESQAPNGDNNVWDVRPAKPFPALRPIRLRCVWQGGAKTSFVFYLGP